MDIVKTERLVHEYIRRDEEGNVESIKKAVDGVELTVRPGEFIAILGHNGSGKSTLAKHINAILTPSEGTVWVDGKDTGEAEHVWEIRQSAGMVFQNPDNQIIGTVVEEDVGFGPENMGIPTDEIWERVAESLQAVKMLPYRHHSPNKLSGGQKQRVAIAGVVAMHPKCIVLDEPTAMLDPNGRRDVIRTARALNQVEGVTIILITHYMEEVVHADRVFVMDQGKIVMEGTPREIFSQVEKLKEYRMDVPQATLLAHELSKQGVPLPPGILTREELVRELCRLFPPVRLQSICLSACDLSQCRQADGLATHPLNEQNADAKQPQERVSAGFANAGVDGRPHGASHRTGGMILDHVNYIYEQDTAYRVRALKDISLKIEDGEFIGIIGHTGSGKSTLIQHLNGLLRATSGAIYFNGEDIYDRDYDMRKLRSKVGLVFQYPEYQLFDVTVFKDVCFGPKNLGYSEKEAELLAFEALKKVGLAEEFYNQSPFDLSGGQKRRAAIAGVLAMKPEVLILDEPTAGLDPKGRDEILEQISRLHRENGITILLVSHSMEDMARYAKRLIVMNKGQILHDGVPREVFRHYKSLEEIGLAAPQVTYIMHALREQGVRVDTGATTVEEAKTEILRALGK